MDKAQPHLQPKEPSEALQLRLKHLEEEYRLARLGLFGGKIMMMLIILAVSLTVQVKMQILGASYVWVVFIIAAAFVTYYAFVFGRLARIKGKMTKTSTELEMSAGDSVDRRISN